MTKTLSLNDYYNLRRASMLAVSPCGEQAAYVVSAYREKENDSYQNIWLSQTDGQQRPHCLTRGDNKDGNPAWSPDGRYLAFLSQRDNEIQVAVEVDEEVNGDSSSKPKPQIWLLDLERGGEPRQITQTEEGVSEFDWSPDGEHLVFSSRTPDCEQKDYLSSVRGEDEDGDKGPVVLTRTQHKHDGQGFLDDIRTHLFIVDINTREVRQITDGPCDEKSPRWSPDGKWILFVSNRTGDADNNRREDLWLVSACGEKFRRCTFGDLSVSNPRWSIDSNKIAFVSTLEPENTYSQNQLMLIDISAGEPVEELSECVADGWSKSGSAVADGPVDDPVSNARVYPVAERETPCEVLTQKVDRPVLSHAEWMDDHTIWVMAGDRGQGRLLEIDISRGETNWLFPSDEQRSCTLGYGALSAGGGRAVVGVDRPETGLDLYQITPEYPDRAVRLTHLNEEWLSNRRTAEYRRVNFENSEGQQVEGLVAVPDSFDRENDTAPLITKIHGGPCSFDSPRFQFDVQYWASMGYLVLMVNYRGSITYGEEFSEVIRGDWGPREHDDVMAGVNHLIQQGWADEDQLYCTGFSQGGIMTNWAVGHTDRFQAAASEHGLWDYVAAFGTDDCHLWWQDDWGVPWQNEKAYRRTSPMSGVENIQTPLMITAGEKDWRCPLSQAEQLYVALKKRGIPTQLVIYQDERHAITKPKRAIDRIRRIAEWFSEYGGFNLKDDEPEGYADPQ